VRHAAAPMKAWCRTSLLALLLTAPIALAPAMAQPAASIQFSGAVNQPKSFTLDDLRKLPATEEAVAYTGEKGEEKASYTGVKLWALLANAGGIADTAKRADLRHTLTITGRDGYAVVLSLGELDPDFGDKPAMIAYSRDRQPFDPARGFRLIVPGDRHGGRSVRDVVTIEAK
jgi:DMSO/TMAO reductase YedYZ molybdopterin-dependent catalytic subunit